MNTLSKLKYFFLLLFLVSYHLINAQTKFKVTLDAGHGDHDPGAQYHGFIEKEINLAIVLKIGKLLENKPEISVNYTRKTDVFIGLIERADIANRVDANIFVSIHCNANKNLSAFGSETFVMGINKIKSNLEAAKRENSVISLEKDYKKKYQGFDINNPETMFGLTIMQEEFESNSIALADKIQKKFKNTLNVKSRGVSQAPYMVLHKAYMPRVLVETGFISNEEDGARLNSEQGQQDIAEAIVAAILDYKKDYFDSDSNNEPEPEKQPVKVKTDAPAAMNSPKSNTISTKENSSGTIFKVQLSSTSKKIATKSSNFKGLKDVESTFENKMFKYTYGETSDYETAKENLKTVKDKGYKTAFLVAYKNGKSINVNLAINQ